MSPDHRPLIIGISGVSSSGKTTLARLLRDIFPGTFILHEDDFYKTDSEIPVKNGFQDWDCIEAIDLSGFETALSYIKEHGKSPPNFLSKEDQNSVGETDVDQSVIDTCKTKTSLQRKDKSNIPIAIIDGFLLYSEGMKNIRELFDVKLFLRTSYKTAKTRREARSGYVTLEGFWEDPPGYVDKVVWPNYVEDHAFLFKNGDVEGAVDKRACESLEIQVMPQSGEENMTKCLEWACAVVEEALDDI
ncbi:hypothetical protein B0A49_09597 [Cryomyces minteri]|uniref:Phosphoribulokinase/uridine kinase domain-containing protein n=1 Tax=Cryomyces minteri TaxID=331657 RepID=A0A4U0WKN0_9PEZI|nr:hypothetical protein B0A49_09597 [Cryomyces minteri]